MSFIHSNSFAKRSHKTDGRNDGRIKTYLQLNNRWLRKRVKHWGDYRNIWVRCVFVVNFAFESTYEFWKLLFLVLFKKFAPSFTKCLWIYVITMKSSGLTRVSKKVLKWEEEREFDSEKNVYHGTWMNIFNLSDNEL